MNSSDNIPILSISQFRELDYAAVNNYRLPIELMMVNAGLNLARLLARYVVPESKILIGVGKGNNGGGGLASARRLLGWGYKVWMHIPDQALSPSVQLQLERVLTFGARKVLIKLLGQFV